MIGLFLRKIDENRVTVILLVLISSLSLFLAGFFGTMGFNTLSEIKTVFDSNSNYKFIYADITDVVKDRDLIKNLDDEKISGISTVSQRVTIVKNEEKDVLVSEFSPRYDLVVPGGKIVEGRELLSPGEALIGKSILDFMHYDYTEVIGNNLQTEYNETYTIVGVYDDSEENVNSGCFVSTESDFEPEAYIIEENDIERVVEVTSNLEKEGFEVMSYASQIVEEQHYASIISTVVCILSLSIIIFASAILYCCLKMLLLDMYPFVAMIKAIGYRKSDYAKLVYATAAVIQLFSTIIVVVAYCLGMQGINILFKSLGIIEIQGVSVDKMTTLNVPVLVGSIFVAGVGMFLVAILCIQKLEKLQVSEILCEANQ
jgi:hypothetical protein